MNTRRIQRQIAALILILCIPVKARAEVSKFKPDENKHLICTLGATQSDLAKLAKTLDAKKFQIFEITKQPGLSGLNPRYQFGNYCMTEAPCETLAIFLSLVEGPLSDPETSISTDSIEKETCAKYRMSCSLLTEVRETFVLGKTDLAVEKIRRTFSHANSLHISSDKNFLLSHIRSKKDYAAYLSEKISSKAVKATLAFEATSKPLDARHCSGIPVEEETQKKYCDLQSSSHDLDAERLTTINELLHRKDRQLYLAGIANILNNASQELKEGFFPEEIQDRLKDNPSAKKEILALAKTHSSIGMRFSLLNIARLLKWITEQDFQLEQDKLLTALLKPPVSLAIKKALCSRDKAFTFKIQKKHLSKGTLADSNARDAMTCLKANDLEIQLELVNELKHTKDSSTIQAITEYLGSVKASDSRVIKALTEVLKSQDAFARNIAVVSLASIAPKDDDSRKAFLEALGSGDNDLKIKALTLLKLNPPKEPSDQAIVANLTSDADAPIRRAAVEVLGNVDSEALSKESIEKLVTALSDRNPTVSAQAYKALAKVAASSSALQLKLADGVSSPNEIVRQNAAKAFDSMHGLMNKSSFSEETQTKLVKGLSDPNDKVRRDILFGLFGSKELSKATLLEVAKRLADKDEQAAQYAWAILHRIESKDRDISLAIANVLFSGTLPDRDIQNWKMLRLYGVGVLPILEAALKSKTLNTDLAYGLLLTANGDENEHATLHQAAEKAFTERLKDKEYRKNDAIRIWFWAAHNWWPKREEKLVELLKESDPQLFADTLGGAEDFIKRSPENARLVSKLLYSQKDDEAHNNAKYAAINFLKKYPELNPDITQALLACVKNAGENLNFDCLSLLATQKVNNPEISKLLASHLDSSDDKRTRESVVGMIFQFKPIDPKHVSKVVEILKNDKNSDVQIAAVKALSTLESATPETRAALINALEEKNRPLLTEQAIKAFDKLKINDPEAQIKLAQQIEKSEYHNGWFAAETLYNLKATEPRVIPYLIKGLNNPHEYARKYSALALAASGTKDPIIFQKIAANLDQKSYVAACGAAEALGEANANTPEIQKALTAILEREAHCTREAFQALKKFEPTDPAVLASLEKIEKKYPNIAK